MGASLSSAEEAERRRLYDEGLTDAAIGARVGKSKRVIADWRTARGLKPVPRLPRPPNAKFAARRERAIETYATGINAKLAAREHGTDAKELRAELRRRALLRRGGPAYYPMLRDARVSAILGKVPDRVIAEYVGCDRCTVKDRRRVLGVPAFRRPLLSRISVISLDAPAALGGSRHDLNKDEKWNDWLEESGATIW